MSDPTLREQRRVRRTRARLEKHRSISYLLRKLHNGQDNPDVRDRIALLRARQGKKPRYKRVKESYSDGWVPHLSFGDPDVQAEALVKTIEAKYSVRNRHESFADGVFASVRDFTGHTDAFLFDVRNRKKNRTGFLAGRSLEGSLVSGESHEASVISRDAVHGAYELVREIGKGRFGVVYEAVRRCDGTSVALKLFANPLLKHSEVRNLEYLAQLQHKNLAQVTDVVRDAAGNALGVEMELLSGKTLREHIRDESFDYVRIHGRMVELADALVYLHHNGILHRDVKPENIMILADGTLKLLDFGLAKLFRSDPSVELSEGTVALTQGLIGTPSVLATEVLAGQEPTEKSDVASAMRTMFFMLNGRFPRDASDKGDLGNSYSAPMMLSELMAQHMSTQLSRWSFVPAVQRHTAYYLQYELAQAAHYFLIYDISRQAPISDGARSYASYVGGIKGQRFQSPFGKRLYDCLQGSERELDFFKFLCRNASIDTFRFVAEDEPRGKTAYDTVSSLLDVFTLLTPEDVHQIDGDYLPRTLRALYDSCLMYAEITARLGSARFSFHSDGVSIRDTEPAVNYLAHKQALAFLEHAKTLEPYVTRPSHVLNREELEHILQEQHAGTRPAFYTERQLHDKIKHVSPDVLESLAANGILPHDTVADYHRTYDRLHRMLARRQTYTTIGRFIDVAAQVVATVAGAGIAYSSFLNTEILQDYALGRSALASLIGAAGGAAGFVLTHSFSTDFQNLTAGLLTRFWKCRDDHAAHEINGYWRALDAVNACLGDAQHGAAQKVRDLHASLRYASCKLPTFLPDDFTSFSTKSYTIDTV